MSPILSLSFISVVAILYSILIIGVLYASNRVSPRTRMPLYLVRLIFGGWILGIGFLGIQGFFLDFDGKPPRILLAALIAAVGSSVLSFSQTARRWVQEIPMAWLIGVQSFRILIEIQLHFLSQTPLLPKLMTYSGRNFDIVTGITALALAPSLGMIENRFGEKTKRRVVFAWNVMGLVLLANVVIHGILSTPTLLQTIFVDPPNTAVGHFPFVWLPTFVVPCALALHLLALQKLRVEKQA